MEFIKPGTKIDFVKYMPLAVAVSMLFVLLSWFGMLFYPGINWGIDFRGGAELQVQFKKNIDMGKLREAMQSLNMGEVKVQRWLTIGEAEQNRYLIRIEKLAPAEPDRASPLAGDSQGKAEPGLGGASSRTTTLVENKLAEAFGAGSFEILRTDFVGPKVGKDLRNKGLLSIVVANLALLIYITLRFEFRYALGAIFSLIHDISIVAGAVIWMHKDFTLVTIAVLLTILGYSINDTIVIYDRIRENLHKMRRLPYRELVNVSVNETLSRTILTSFTVFLVVLFLFIMGGSEIHDFAFAMLVGVVFGTYSSVYVATAFVVWIESIRAKKRTVAPEKP